MSSVCIQSVEGNQDKDETGVSKPLICSVVYFYYTFSGLTGLINHERIN